MSTAQQIKDIITKYRNLEVGSTRAMNQIEDLIDQELAQEGP